MKKGLVFDLDGTLVDSLPGIAEAINSGLEAMGFPVHPPGEVRKMVGKGSRELCRSALASETVPPENVSPELVENLRLRFMDFYHGTWKSGTVVYPGIGEMLRRLAEGGHALAVLSNKPHEVTVPLVALLFGDIPFSPVMGNSDHFPRKPDPASLLHIAGEWGVNPADIVMVGDSAHDGNTALNAESGLVLVGWGYSTRSALEAFDSPIAGSADDLYRILAGE